jgi:hypothetical protein
MPQTQATVVVAFSSRCGATEALALAAAVGAVQGRALIRLRRLPDDGSAPGPSDSPECRDALSRMRKEYVPPTEADITGNDALILAPPAGSSTGSKEWVALCDMLARLGSAGKLAGKVGAVVDAGDEETLRTFSALIASAGFGSVPPDALTPASSGDLARQATACGRRVASGAGARAT